MAALEGAAATRQSEVTQWQIFNELDLKEESEMLELATFLDSLMREFAPNSRKHSLENLQTDEEEDDGVEVHRHAEDFEAPSHADAHGIAGIGTSFRIARGNSIYNIPDMNLMDYGPLPKGPLTPESASEIIDVYRRGGKLAYKSFKKLLRDVYKKLKGVGNVIRVPMASDSVNVHVIGDLHGQLEDLLHILDDAGLPDANNIFLFNGDFVDRGDHSVEIIAILFSLYLAFPDYVFLNRGNHEDHVICCQPPPPHGCGGFQRECKSKYDDLVFSMVVEVFRYLPIFHIIEEKICVIHGGLFYRKGVTIDDLEAIDRLDYCPVPGEEDPPTNPEEARGQDLRQLMRDALWSDPKPDPGCEFNNARKQGQLFGPDVCQEFLQTNDLHMVVRSHECMKLGFSQAYAEMPHLLATIFSASGYGGSNNMGAYMTFTKVDPGAAYKVMTLDGEPSGLFFTVQNYTVGEASGSIEQTNKTSMRALVLRKKQQLVEEFVAADTMGTGKVTIEQWGTIMVKVTGVVINWPELLPLLGVEAEHVASGEIEYQTFISELRAGFNRLSQVGNEDTETLFNAMYANRNTLECVFAFFDLNGDGIISKEEFHHGCEVLNKKLPKSSQISRPERLLELMDIDGSDGIDINEFFEVFRLVDAADGSVDGKISIVDEKAAEA